MLDAMGAAQTQQAVPAAHLHAEAHALLPLWVLWLTRDSGSSPC